MRTRRRKSEETPAVEEEEEEQVETTKGEDEDEVKAGEQAEEEKEQKQEEEQEEQKQEETEQAAEETEQAAPPEKDEDEQQQSDEGQADAAAAAAAVAARLMQSHGQQQEYPVSSGVQHLGEVGVETHGTNGNTNGNKRPRDDEDAWEPERKRASSGAMGANDGDAMGGDAGAHGGVTETMQVPAMLVGKLIGRGGETIRQLQATTGTHIQVDHSGVGPEKSITITGKSIEDVARAKAAILTVDSNETSQIIQCPPSVVGRIIGRGGETIRALQSASEARITVNQDFPPDHPREVIINGKSDACERAALMINELIHGEPGSAQAIIQRVCQLHGIGKSDVMLAPKMIIGRIIGRGGETIKQIQKMSGATIQIDQSEDPCKVSLAGQPSAVEQAKGFINEIMSGGDPFAPNAYGGGGGYGQQGMYGAPAGYGSYGGGGYGAQAGYGAQGGYGGYGAAAGYGAGGYPGYGADYGAYGAPAAGGQYADYAAAPGAMPGQDMHAAPAAAPPAAGQWIEYRDDQNRPYYYNTVTGVTQWEKPPEM
jgi:far upstream element-binding protein